MEGRIGPNAILRTLEALREQEGEPTAQRVFRAACLARYLDNPPAGMVPEGEVAALAGAVERELEPEIADAIARESGRRTAEYLLAHRIPALFQRLLRALPVAVSGRLLVRAIRGHAWTFVGSGRLSLNWRGGIRAVIEDCPLCGDSEARIPRCLMFAATFEHLCRRLIDPEAKLRDLVCAAAGGKDCAFEIACGRAARDGKGVRV